MTRVQVHSAVVIGHVGVTIWVCVIFDLLGTSSGSRLACLLLRWDTFALCIGQTGLVSLAHKLKTQAEKTVASVNPRNVRRPQHALEAGVASASCTQRVCYNCEVNTFHVTARVGDGC
eukprot:1730384-Amphidinium_carterae.1